MDQRDQLVEAAQHGRVVGVAEVVTPGCRYFAAWASRNWVVTTSESENEPFHITVRV